MARNRTVVSWILLIWGVKRSISTTRMVNNRVYSNKSRLFIPTVFKL